MGAGMGEWGQKRPFCLYMAGGLPESGLGTELYMGVLIVNCEVGGETAVITPYLMLASNFQKSKRLVPTLLAARHVLLR